MSQREENHLDLKKFQKHKRKFPWGLIGKIAMAIIIIGLLLYLNKSLSNKKAELPKEVEIEIDTNSVPEVSPDQ